MLTIKEMIERLIELREQGTYITLLAVCPNSEAVLEAAVKAAARNHAPMLFAATLNQVDRDGGYTGWSPSVFVEKMWRYAEDYDCHAMLLPCLDHGGQWLKDIHTRDQLTFEQTTAEVKASITAVLEAGYQLLHIDPTVDRTMEGALPVEVVVERSLDLLQYAEAERLRLELPPISYEVGTEEVHGGLVDLQNFASFLEQLYAGIDRLGLTEAQPAFVVAQVGTNLHTTVFDAEAARQLHDIAAPYGTLIKGHYSDWVENAEDYPRSGMGGANVEPEFTADEYDALLSLEKREQAYLRLHPEVTPSDFLPTLTRAVIASNRWQKWLQEDEQGLALAELAPARRDWILKTCARYIWTVSEVKAARQHLYNNLEPVFPDPHQYVVNWIAESIEHYIVAFNLFEAYAYFVD